MKKKIYFQLAAMNVGGVEKSWLSLVDSLSRDDYEIHLGLVKPLGGYMDYIPKDITVHHIDCYDAFKREINDPPQIVLKHFFKKGRLIYTLILFVLYLIGKFSNNRYLFYRFITRNEPQFNIEFDEAYAYAGPSQMIDYYVCKKIKAKKKFGWIHFDVQKFGIDKGMTRKLYKVYDKIYVVSETAKQKFDELFPEFKHKTEVRYNIVSQEQIRKMAEEGETFNDNFSGTRILTVGRMTSEKGQAEAIRALRSIIDKGKKDVRWYFIGDGNQRASCEQLASQLGISDHVCFLGLKTNPYAYMRNCHIYMQPSRHEGYCITLAEAKCFNPAIVATNFTGASEQLASHPRSTVTGMSPEEIANGILKFL